MQLHPIKQITVLLEKPEVKPQNQVLCRVNEPEVGIIKIRFYQDSISIKYNAIISISALDNNLKKIKYQASIEK